MIEHNLDVIRRRLDASTSGPEGGDGGGRSLRSARRTTSPRATASHTGRALVDYEEVMAPSAAEKRATGVPLQLAACWKWRALAARCRARTSCVIANAREHNLEIARRGRSCTAASTRSRKACPAPRRQVDPRVRHPVPREGQRPLSSNRPNAYARSIRRNAGRASRKSMPSTAFRRPLPSSSGFRAPAARARSRPRPRSGLSATAFVEARHPALRVARRRAGPGAAPDRRRADHARPQGPRTSGRLRRSS